MGRAQTNEAKRLEAEIGSRISALSSPSTADVRALRRGISKGLRETSPELVIELAIRLVNRSEFLCRFVAYELVLYHRQALSSLDAKTLERLGSGIDSWVAVDVFASYLSGPVWREQLVPDKLIHGWARSTDRWWRRAALVSTVPLNNKTRGGNGDPLRTLQVCELLLDDRDDLVVKAMSWSLRELAKRDPAAVAAFVGKHRLKLAPRVLREVGHKINTGLKNPRRSKTSVSD